MKIRYFIAILISHIVAPPSFSQYSKPRVVYLDSAYKAVKKWEASTYINHKEQVNDTIWRDMLYRTGKPLLYTIDYKDPDFTIQHGLSEYWSEHGVDSIFPMVEGKRHGIARLFLTAGKCKKVFYNKGIIDSVIVVNWPEENEAQDSKAANFIEEESNFPGGSQRYKNALNSSIKYPKQALKKNITGTVAVQFIVNEIGKVDNVKIVNSVEYLLDMELVRAVKNMRQVWSPATIDGNPVKSYKRQSVSFGLQTVR